MNTPGSYAVIPTYDRLEELRRAVSAIQPQVDRVFVVHNGGPRPPAREGVEILTHGEKPPNLSRLWNLGLDAAAEHAKQAGADQWDVAVLNDDVIVPPGWFNICAHTMRKHGGAAACTQPAAPRVLVHTEPGPINLHYRICGYAFILRGELGLRADETIRWWHGDDDLDWRSRKAGGTVVIPGQIEHLHPNEQTTGVLAAQANRDRATFSQKWEGLLPW